MTHFTKERRVHRHHADLVERARRAGYRLATVEDREFLPRAKLFCSSGTVWVKLGELN